MSPNGRAIEQLYIVAEADSSKALAKVIDIAGTDKAEIVAPVSAEAVSRWGLEPGKMINVSVP